MGCALGGGCCGMMCLGMVILWVILSTGLLWITWNKVVVDLMGVKAAKFWQALLIVLTLAVFCGPGKKMSKGCMGGCGKKGCHAGRHHKKGNWNKKWEHKHDHAAEGETTTK